MRHIKSLTTIIMLFLLLGLFTHPRVVEAACNFHQLMTSSTKDVSNFTSTCTITAVEGVDNPQNTETSTTTNASLTLGTNSAITINNGGTLAVNSLSIPAGSIAIQTGGQIKLNTPLYVADADADGYAVDFTLYTASASGRRRLGLMRSFTAADCGDATYSTANSCCTVATRYQDADADTYGNPSVSISACTTGGYVDNNTDCYDANASAYPGSGACSGGNRGDGSYDWNCDGGQSGCGTGFNYVYEVANTYACNGGWSPNGTAVIYNPGGIACGVSNYGPCTGTNTLQLGCNTADDGRSEPGSNPPVCVSAGGPGTQACQ